MLSDLQEDMDNNIQSIIDNLDKNFDELMASIGENATSSAETVKSAMTGIVSFILDSVSMVRL